MASTVGLDSMYRQEKRVARSGPGSPVSPGSWGGESGNGLARGLPLQYGCLEVGQ
jgi:hypothetical protein